MRAVAFDAADPPSLARFWAAVTDREIINSRPDLARLKSETPGGPVLLFLRVPEGKTVKNRVHIDFTSEDRVAEVERVVGLGATIHSDVKEPGYEWTVLQDPEGNEFCIVQATEK